MLKVNMMCNEVQTLFENGMSVKEAIQIVKENEYRRSQEAKEQYENMTNEELAVMYQQGNRYVLDILIKKNMGIIIKAAKKFATNRVSVQDLTNEAVIAFIKYLPKYDVNKGKVTTFMTWWLMSHLQKKYVKMYFTLNISESYYRINGFEACKNFDTFSMNYSIQPHDDKNKIEFVNLIESEESPIEDLENKILIKNLLDKSNLSDKQFKYIKEYFGFDGECKTSEQIAKKHRTSQYKVNKELKTAIKHLRSKMNLSCKKEVNLKEIRSML